jgi:hypothetical protein
MDRRRTHPPLGIGGEESPARRALLRVDDEVIRLRLTVDERERFKQVPLDL